MKAIHRYIKIIINVRYGIDMECRIVIDWNGRIERGRWNWGLSPMRLERYRSGQSREWIEVWNGQLWVHVMGISSSHVFVLPFIQFLVLHVLFMFLVPTFTPFSLSYVHVFSLSPFFNSISNPFPILYSLFPNLINSSF